MSKREIENGVHIVERDAKNRVIAMHVVELCDEKCGG